MQGDRGIDGTVGQRGERALLDERERLWRATYGLRMSAPHLSAHNGMTLKQRKAVICAGGLLLLAFAWSPIVTGIATIAPGA